MSDWAEKIQNDLMKELERGGFITSELIAYSQIEKLIGDALAAMAPPDDMVCCCEYDCTHGCHTPMKAKEELVSPVSLADTV